MKALLPTLAFTLAASAAAASAPQTQYMLDFYTNTMPSGWHLTKNLIGNNYGIKDGRFFSGQTDSAALLWTDFRISPVAELVEFRWDGNISKTYWGAQSGVVLTDSLGRGITARWRTATVVNGSQVELVLATADELRRIFVEIPEGDYRFIASFTNAFASFSGSLNGVERFNTSMNISAPIVSSANRIDLWTYQTIGPDVWMDNIWIQAAVVPEPRTAALFALGVLGVAGLRKVRGA